MKSPQTRWTGQVILCHATGHRYKIGSPVGSGASAVVCECFRLDDEATNSTPSENVSSPGRESDATPKNYDSNTIDSTATLSNSSDPCSQSLQPSFPHTNSLYCIRSYAVKIIDIRGRRLSLDYEDAFERLCRESKILASVDHPCVVHLFDTCMTSDEIYLIMEYIPHGELFDLVLHQGSFSEPRACFIFHQIVAAVKYLHSKDIIHRDIKLENVLICGEVSSGFYQVKVADLGLARTFQTQNAAMTCVGTPQYWAPEIIGSAETGIPYGKQADLWSLGVLLFVMLGGAYPFDNRMGPLADLIKAAKYHFFLPKMQRISESAKSLIRSLLTVDVTKRATIEDIENHDWMRCWLNPVNQNPKDPFFQTEKSKQFHYLMPPLPYPYLSSFTKEESVQETRSASQNEWAMDSVQHNINDKFPENDVHTENCIVEPEVAIVNQPMLSDKIPSTQSTSPLAAMGIVCCNSSKIKSNDLPTYCTSALTSSSAEPNSIFTSSDKDGMILQYKNLDKPITFSTAIPDPPHRAKEITYKSPTKDMIGVLNDLKKCQLQIRSRLQLALLALRHEPELYQQLHMYLLNYCEVQRLSVMTVKKFEHSCSSVLEIMQDLLDAIANQVPELADQLLQDVQGYASALQVDVKKMYTLVTTLLNDLSAVVMKARMEKRMSESRALASLPNDAVVSKKDFDNSGFNTITAISPYAPQKLEVLRESLMCRLKDIVSGTFGGNEVEDTDANAMDTCSSEQLRATERHRRLAEDVFDFIFLTPVSVPVNSNNKSDSQESIVEESGEVSTDSKDMASSEGGIVAESKLPFLSGKQGVTSLSAHFTSTNPSASSHENVESVPGGSLQLLVKALHELRCVTTCFDQCALFWGNLDSTLIGLMQRRKHMSRLIHYAHYKAFDQRLQYKFFAYQEHWHQLQQCCREYCNEIEADILQSEKFAVELQETADKFDTFKMLVYMSEKQKK